MSEVIKGLKGETDGLYANGLHLAGERYVLTKVDEDAKVLYARKVCSLFLSLTRRHPTPRFSSLNLHHHIHVRILSRHDILYESYMLILNPPKIRAKTDSSSVKPSKQSS